MKLSASFNSRPRPRRFGDRRRAFTILEVAMATFVLGFGIATSIIAMQWGFRHLDLARSSTIASQIIQSHIEGLRMKNFTKITELMTVTASQPQANPFITDGATNFTTNSDLVGKYTLTRLIEVDTARPTEAVNIKVTVTWRSYDGRLHTRSFTSTFTKNGLYDYYYTLAHS